MKKIGKTLNKKFEYVDVYECEKCGARTTCPELHKCLKLKTDYDSCKKEIS